MMMNDEKRRGYDWAWLLAFTAVYLLIQLIPYLLGYATAAPGTFYTGLIMNPEDSQTYWAKMLQGYNGRWLYTIPFTTEVHGGAFIGVFYLFLGHVARWLDVSLTAVWHAARIIAGFMLSLAVYHFIARFLADRRARWTAFLLAMFGSGLGWLLFLLGQTYWLGHFPVDFKQPGAHLFFTAMTFPHITLATALILFIVCWLERAVRGGWRAAVAAGIAHIFLGILYPHLIYLTAVIAVLAYGRQVWQERRVLLREGVVTAVAFLIPLPLNITYAVILRVNPAFRAWADQSVTRSAPWPHYVLSFGLMLVLAGWFWRQRPSARPRFAILWMWIIAAALLLYAPINPQRRYVQGVQIPLAILAAMGWQQVLLPRLQATRFWRWLAARPRYDSQRLARFLTLFFLLFMSLSNIFIVADLARVIAAAQPDPLFRPQVEKTAADWLRDNAPQTAVILGAYQTGNYAAAHAGQRVVIGHWVETGNFEAKSAEVAQFFAADTPDSWRRAFLEKYRVDIIWYGPREQELGGFDPAAVPYLFPWQAITESDQQINLYLVQLNP